MLRLFDRDDRSVLRRVRAVLADADRAGDAHSAHCQVEHGVVTLEGTVGHRRDMLALEGLVWRVPGVVGVRNRVQVSDGRSRSVNGEGNA